MLFHSLSPFMTSGPYHNKLMGFWLAVFPGGCPGLLLGPGWEQGQKASRSTEFWDAPTKINLNIYIVERDYFSCCNEAISKIDRVLWSRRNP